MEMYDEMYFTGKYDGPSIEKYIAHHKLLYGQQCRLKVKDYLRDDAYIWWWNSVNMDMLYMLSDEDFEKLLLDRWYSTKKKNNESHNTAIKKDHALQVHIGVHTKNS